MNNEYKDIFYIVEKCSLNSIEYKIQRKTNSFLSELNFQKTYETLNCLEQKAFNL